MTERVRVYEDRSVNSPGEEEANDITVWEFDNVLFGDRKINSMGTVHGLNHNQTIQYVQVLGRLGVKYADPKVYKK